MESLVEDMTQDEPSLRPTMDEVVDRFTDIALCIPERAMTKPLRKPWRSRLPKIFRPSQQ